MKLINSTWSIILISIIMMSCKPNQSKKQNVKELTVNEIITKEGTYTSKRQDLSIQIESIKGLLAYKISDLEGNILFENGEPTPSISSHHQWGILVDLKEMIWINSSDIGLYFLKKDEVSKYALKSFGMLNSENVKDIPKPIYEQLPESLKNKFPY